MAHNKSWAIRIMSPAIGEPILVWSRACRVTIGDLAFPAITG